MENNGYKKPSKFFKWFCGTWVGRLFYGDLAETIETYEYMDHFMATHPNEKPGPIPEHLLEPINANGKTTPAPQTTSAPVVENEETRSATGSNEAIRLTDREALLAQGVSKEAVEVFERKMAQLAMQSGLGARLGDHGVVVDVQSMGLDQKDALAIESFYQNKNQRGG